MGRFLKPAAFAAGTGALLLFLPEVALASVEGTLTAIQNKFVNVLLPLAAVLGLVYAGFSFLTGNPQARSHLILAILGAAVGFGANSIVGLIRSIVQ